MRPGLVWCLALTGATFVGYFPSSETEQIVLLLTGCGILGMQKALPLYICHEWQRQQDGKIPCFVELLRLAGLVYVTMVWIPKQTRGTRKHKQGGN